MSTRTPASPRRRPVTVVLAAATTGVLALTAGACTSTPPSTPASAPASAASAGVSGQAGAAAASFPVTVENCGSTFTFATAPERVVLLKSASVPYLSSIGVLDKVVAKAGVYPDAYYDNATNAALGKIPSLTDKVDPSGHLLISKEVVMGQSPDLVLGISDTVNTQTLAGTGIPLLEVPALCKSPTAKPGFDGVYEQLSMYGHVFGRPQQAAAATSELKAKVAEMTAKVPSRPGKTGVVLYPTVGGGTTYAYGNLSMADPQLTMAGFKNVFGDVDKRVFEVSVEQLLAKDPDVIVLLYSEGNAAQVKQALLALPGADKLKAVKEGRIHVQLLNFTEPPSPLALQGLEKIDATFADVR